LSYTQASFLRKKSQKNSRQPQLQVTKVFQHLFYNRVPATSRSNTELLSHFNCHRKKTPKSQDYRYHDYHYYCTQNRKDA